MEQVYVVTITSGTYDDYVHGVLFALADAGQAIAAGDDLNKLARYYYSLQEEIYEWYEAYDAENQCGEGLEELRRWASAREETMKRFIMDNRQLPEELKIIDSRMRQYGMDPKLGEWPEEAVFAYLPVKLCDWS